MVRLLNVPWKVNPAPDAILLAKLLPKLFEPYQPTSAARFPDQVIVLASARSAVIKAAPAPTAESDASRCTFLLLNLNPSSSARKLSQAVPAYNVR
jgi:hypothetical protein